MSDQKINIIYSLVDKASKGLKSISGSIFNIINPLNALRSVGQSVMSGLASLVKGSMSAWDTQRKVLAQTSAVLTSMGGASGVTAKEVAELAGAFQKTTNYGDEVTQSGINMLLTFKNINKDVLPNATGLMLDMSTAMGTDVKGSAIQLGKALNDPVNGISALSRVGIQFSDVQKEQIEKLQKSGDLMGAQTIIMKELETQFGGSAKAMADPFTQMKNAVGDVGEQIGRLLSSVLAPFAEAMRNMSAKIVGYLEKIDVEALRLNVAIGFSRLQVITEKAMAMLRSIISKPFDFETYRHIFNGFMENVISVLNIVNEIVRGGVKNALGMIRKFREDSVNDTRTFAQKTEDIEKAHLERVEKMKEESLKRQSSMGGGSFVPSGNDDEALNSKLELEKGLTQITETEIQARLALIQAEHDFKNELNEMDLQARISYNELNLENELLTFERRKEMLNELFGLREELRNQNLERDTFFHSEEQKIVEQRSELVKRGIGYEMQMGRVLLDAGRKAGDQKLNLAEAVAQGVLDFAKKEVIAQADTKSASLMKTGMALLSASMGTDPRGYGHIAGAVLLSAGVRALVNPIKLAEGGVVMPRAGGVSATIAEAGAPEAVIPLDDPRSRDMLGNGGGMGHLTITLDGYKELAKGIYKTQTELIRSGQLSERR
jgi:hypothetical protein